ncbi:hypothetical protein HBH95_153910 [Parastagonospora nodorum]|nr:hypothetical protein HBH95_153910 [Parastagonospora nodorum]
MMIADVMALVRQRTAQMHELESQSEWRITGTTWTWTNMQPIWYCTYSIFLIHQISILILSFLYVASQMGAQTSAYETFVVEKHLNDSIVGQAKFQYGLLNRQGHDWNVVLEEGMGHDKWIAHLFVYTNSDGLADRVFLDQSESIWNGTLSRLGLLANL